MPPKWVPFPTTVAFRRFEVLRVFDDMNREDVYTDAPALQRFRQVLSGCDAIAVRDCMEFEPEWLSLLEDVHRKPVLPVGLLPTRPNIEIDDNDKWKTMKEWLDLQSKGSVVYVSIRKRGRTESS